MNILGIKHNCLFFFHLITQNLNYIPYILNMNWGKQEVEVKVNPMKAILSEARVLGDLKMNPYIRRGVNVTLNLLICVGLFNLVKAAACYSFGYNPTTFRRDIEETNRKIGLINAIGATCIISLCRLVQIVFNASDR